MCSKYLFSSTLLMKPIWTIKLRNNNNPFSISFLMYKNFLLFVVTNFNSEGNIFSAKWTNLQNMSMKIV